MSDNKTSTPEFPLERWEQEARRKIMENPKITADELADWFGMNNFGYFPKVPEILRVLRKETETACKKEKLIQ